jgi:RNA polymerase sigma-70 factor (ECF subfamily)
MLDGGDGASHESAPAASSPIDPIVSAAARRVLGDAHDAIAEVAADAVRIGAAGRAAWPGARLADDALAAHLAARRRDDRDGRSPPAHDADLYLAIALALRDAGALRIFESQLVPLVAQVLGRMRLPASAIEEVQQALRVELLVGDPVPRIGDYGGRGELAGWLRVTATHKALKLIRTARREETLDEVILSHWPDAAPTPAQAHLRARCAADVKQAIAGSLAALDVRARNLLRQHVLDGLTIDELARIYRVHRATCARWLADARGELARGMRRRLTASLGASNTEIDSVLRFIDSDIDLSIARLLAEPAP